MDFLLEKQEALYELVICKQNISDHQVSNPPLSGVDWVWIAFITFLMSGHILQLKHPNNILDPLKLPTASHLSLLSKKIVSLLTGSISIYYAQNNISCKCSEYCIWSDSSLPLMFKIFISLSFPGQKQLRVRRPRERKFAWLEEPRPRRWRLWAEPRLRGWGWRPLPTNSTETRPSSPWC